MAKGGSVPGFFQKRDLLYAAQPDAGSLRATADGCVGEGLLETALELYGKAGDAAGAERVLEAARAAGDGFAVEAALRALGHAAPPGLWVEVGEKALAAGKLWFAYRAFEKADEQGGLERVRRAMAEAQIAVPAAVL